MLSICYYMESPLNKRSFSILLRPLRLRPLKYMLCKDYTLSTYIIICNPILCECLCVPYLLVISPRRQYRLIINAIHPFSLSYSAHYESALSYLSSTTNLVCLVSTSLPLLVLYRPPSIYTNRRDQERWWAMIVQLDKQISTIG